MPLTSQSESHGKVQSDRGKKKAMTWRSAGDTDKGVNVKGLVAQSCPLLCDPHGLWPAKLPRPWDSPGKNTGLGCHFLWQEIFPTQGEPGSPALQADSLLSEPQGSPKARV